jgi:NACHT domain
MPEKEHFKAWLNDTESGTFWLSGILGSGKSVVCAATLDHLLCMPRGDKDYIAFFFCQFDNADSLMARTIIGALIRQCISADALSQTVEAKLIELFKSASPDAEDLEELFLDVVRASKAIKIVIDGLDECSRPARIVVLKLLRRLLSSQPMVKVFLSSRDNMIGDIATVFDTCIQLTMDCEEALSDIPLYVNSIIEEKIEAGELEVGSVQLVQDIRNTLIQESNGM